MRENLSHSYWSLKRYIIAQFYHADSDAIYVHLFHVKLGEIAHFFCLSLFFALQSWQYRLVASASLNLKYRAREMQNNAVHINKA